MHDGQRQAAREDAREEEREGAPVLWGRRSSAAMGVRVLARVAEQWGREGRHYGHGRSHGCDNGEARWSRVRVREREENGSAVSTWAWPLQREARGPGGQRHWLLREGRRGRFFWM